MYVESAFFNKYMYQRNDRKCISKYFNINFKYETTFQKETNIAKAMKYSNK